MPKPSQTTTAVAYKNQLMIVGLELEMVFSFNNNMYYSLASPKLLPNTGKIILQAGSKYFIIQVTKVWETQDFNKWECYELNSKNIPNGLALLTYPVAKENHVYFVFNDYLLRRFNISSHSVEVIKKISGLDL